MPYNIRYDADRSIVRITLTSKFELTLAKVAARDAMEIASTHDCKALLMDFRETALVDETAGIYAFVTSLPELGVKHNVIIACVSCQPDPGHRFLETSARNRGYDVKCFRDVSSAEDWLAGKSSAFGGAGGTGRVSRQFFA
jgi:hypothetical protein